MAQIISDFKTLVEVAGLLPETKHDNIIAISGFGGSGKTTLALELSKNLANSVVVKADDFMLNDYTKRSPDWHCIDRSRIIAQVLQPAEQGKEIHYQTYDWATNSLGSWNSAGRPSYIILEGIGIIHPSLLPYYNFSIWIDTPIETGAARGMKRDKKIQGIDHDKLWREVWIPNDQDYFAKYHPDQLAEYIYRTA